MRRANDPQRREKIIQATLEAVKLYGIHAVTHRKIATRALDAFIEGMTLHFVTDRKPLSREEILRMVERVAG